MEYSFFKGEIFMKYLFLIVLIFVSLLLVSACPLTDESKQCMVELVKDNIQTDVLWQYRITKEKCFPGPGGSFEVILETSLDNGLPVYLSLSAYNQQLDEAELHYFPQYGDILDVTSCF